MRKPLLAGSNNRDKAAELMELLAGTPWEVKNLSEFPAVPEPVEDAETFEGNAFIKAHYYSERFQMACVADDSGLEVDALDGAPGVYAARYAGENCTYSDNNRKLLEALINVPEAERTARFVCCAAFVGPGGDRHVEFGTVDGRIALECRGEHGFGYDPLFVPEGYTQTFAELDPSVKQRISHRGRAFRQMRDCLVSLM